MIRYVLVIFLLLFQYNNALAAKDPTAKIDEWKKAVVSITNQVIKSPYNNTGEFYGTGFIIDKKAGIIATNRHVVNYNNINDTFVTFHNGREVQVSVIYSDPQHDFSFLKTSAPIPDDCTEFKFATKFPQLNESVTIIGNNENQGFSIQMGIVTSIYETSNHFPDQTIRISLNARGGSSGSPIINNNGEVLAINYAVDSTYAYALPAHYLNDSISAIKKGIKPKRMDVGAILSYYSLDKAARYLNFPQDLISGYVKKFPDSLNKGLVVYNILNGSPAENSLMPGDIIWAINGTNIGPNLYELQKAVDNSQDSVKLSVYRNGQLIDVPLRPYELAQHTVKKLVSFDNAILFEVDDLIRLITGAPIGTVFAVNVERNSGLSNIETISVDGGPHYLLQIVKLDNKEIKSLDDVIAIIPELRKKENFAVYYKNYAGEGGYNKTIYINRALQFQDVKYSPYDDEPILYTLDETNSKWTSSKIE